MSGSVHVITNGVVVDAVRDGQARILDPGDGTAVLTVLMSPGTFPATVTIGRDAASALAAELARIAGAT